MSPDTSAASPLRRSDKPPETGKRSRGRGWRFVLFSAIAAAVTAVSAVVLVDRDRTDQDDDDWPQSAKLADRGTQRSIVVAGGRIDLIYEPADFTVSSAAMTRWLRESAIATSTYFGRFPVKRVVIRLRSVDGYDVTGGSATAEPDPRITLNIGRYTSERTLFADSTAVHEMAHLAIPDHAERHLWFHEGMATYVETIARAQSGHITPERAWGELAYGMATGVAEGGNERGLDATEIWDRRYWGGAIFFLMADVEIRQRTSGRLGLQDALRSLQGAGGDLSTRWDFSRILRTADGGVGGAVLQDLYRRVARSGAPGRIDGDALERLWRDLGVAPIGKRTVRLDERAPLASVRRAIVANPSQPLLVAAPQSVLQGRSREARTSSWPVLLRRPQVVR